MCKALNKHKWEITREAQVLLLNTSACRGDQAMPLGSSQLKERRVIRGKQADYPSGNKLEDKWVETRCATIT